MGNAAKIRAIYAELRSSIGDAAPAGDLLLLAHAILKSFGTDLDELGSFGQTRKESAFFTLSVDEAMEDGGWKILNFEARRNFDIEDLDPQDFPPLQIEIQRFLGPQWRSAFRNEPDPPKSNVKVEDGKHESSDSDCEEPKSGREGPPTTGESLNATGGSDLLWRLEPAGVGVRAEEAADPGGETGRPVCDCNGPGEQACGAETAS